MKTVLVENGFITPIDKISDFVGVEVYEVLRLMEGIPLFWEEHFQRFRHSLLALRVDIPREPLFWADIKLLISKTGIRNCNVRFSVQIQNGIIDTRRVQFIEGIYPTKEMYENGVELGILEAMRPDPTLKINLPDLRKEANLLMKQNNWFEVLLVNTKKRITEGSRSNVFFIKGNRIYTPPVNQVLPGITRQRVISLIENLGYKYHERDIFLFQVDHMDAMFITGTSPKIMPVKSCVDISFDVGNKVLQSLMKAYDKEIESYLSSKKLPH